MRPVVHSALVKLIAAFIAAKQSSGTVQEKAIYNTPGFSVVDELDRLIRNRPLMFMGSGDRYEWH